MKYMFLLSTMTNLENGSTGMSDDLKGAIITALVTRLISIIGFGPELWFQMRITDYLTNKDEFKNTNNKLIDELKLKTEFKIQ